MSVQQTSQLIQLILNSALMIGVCVLLWGGLWLRYTTLADRLKALHIDYVKLSHALPLGPGVDHRDRLRYLKQQRQKLQYHYRLSKRCTLILHYALLGFLLSIFALAARTLVNLNWLILVALGLFTAGTALLLLSVAMTLLDFQRFQAQPGTGSKQTSLGQTLGRRMGRLMLPRSRRRKRSLPAHTPVPALNPAEYPVKTGTY
ncbi:MAG: DUF2721 domain-containing protein [Cyanobacteria bacterium J06635_15]